MLQVEELHHGARSEYARAVSVAVSKRLKARGFADLAVTESKTVTLDLIEACAKAAWALGAREDTVKQMREDRDIPVGVQRMIRNPMTSRTDLQKRIGDARVEAALKERKKRSEQRKREEKGKSGRTAAVNAFVAKAGTREQPPGSNGGGIISVMEAYWGFGRVPWCGIAAGYHAKKFGGIVGMRSDVASVAAIQNHAQARRGPYGKWQGGPEGALGGAFVVIGGFGVHVGMLIEPLSGGRAKTIEGNTSFGPGGSQSNGGCIAVRVRSAAEIHGVATMSYPK